jgi:hypothetical protein
MFARLFSTRKRINKSFFFQFFGYGNCHQLPSGGPPMTAQITSTDPRKLQFADLDSASKTVIQTILNCKKLVRYVKKVSKTTLIP